MSRVYVGRIPPRCCERDIERFFKGYGRLRDIVLKNGYGFVEFDNEKDADDAVYDLHGRDLRGERLIVEHARLPPGTRGGSRRAGGGGGGGGVCSGRDRRYGPPTRTEYRVIVENLSSRVSWQDLKDLMRKAGEVTYADAHKSAKNDGIVEFAAYSDMKEAIEKFDGYELYGRKLRVYEDRPGQRSRSSSYRSRSNSRHSHRSRSRGSHRRQKSRSPRHRHDRSLSSDRRRSESGNDSHRRSRENSNDLRSRSPSRRSGTNRSNARSISHHSNKRSVDACSRSPSCNGRGNSIKNDLDRRSRSRSASHSHSGSRSCSVESRSPGRSRTHSRSASRSRSRSHRSESGTPRRSDEEMDGRSNCDHEIREGDYDE
ncbi:serine arginine-rich splicing factor, variant 2 [Schistosoma haematobium]|uniref:Serine arginine-rich splicing factor, variant 2 n=1 Tax=Schistosoma haematobium TaxID=6185 RepID=A0A922LWR2_SCHHA|nr:serine arginine-rich splicing factor, variant 2 [Schistosoma haematobium]KAH9595328.1 serine arginine-rich splicing factor, variant 2 [Schistosoma haematobium]CAH8462766.1 unnamed protein product [Schistosoma haematobium]CAH8464190.1 unnamed protein product [Schistosoma haematobium]